MNDINNNTRNWNNIFKEFKLHLIPMLNPEGYLISSCAIRKLIPREMSQEETEKITHRKAGAEKFCSASAFLRDMRVCSQITIDFLAFIVYNTLVKVDYYRLFSKQAVFCLFHSTFYAGKQNVFLNMTNNSG